MSELWVPLDVEDCSASPFDQFARWFNEAKGEMAERDAVALATASPEGRSSVRMVLLRYVDERSFGWYSNYQSRKGVELRENPFAAILWYCEVLGRQIRIEGPIEQMTDVESDAYFASRPRASKLGAHASHQSSTIASREVLDNEVSRLAKEFEGREVPRPLYWGGFRLLPERFEFWQHRESRLHDRIAYCQVREEWHRERLSP